MLVAKVARHHVPSLIVLEIYYHALLFEEVSDLALGHTERSSLHKDGLDIFLHDFINIL